MSALVSGCASSGGDAEDPDHDALSLEAAPVLYLNLTVGNETHLFSTASAGSISGPAGNASTTTTVTSTATGNATAGNGTAGNATDDGALGGKVPLDVSATLGATGLPAGASVGWTLDFGDAGDPGD